MIIGCACSTDTVTVRPDVLPFEPQSRLVVGPIALDDPASIVCVDVLDGDIESGRSFYFHLDVERMARESAECHYIEVTAFPPDGSSEVRSLCHELVTRANHFPLRTSNVVQPPLEFAGQWRGIITVQAGAESSQLGHPRQVAEFHFNVIEPSGEESP